jgi:hypothetical protein
MERRFKVLRFVGSFFKVLAWIYLSLGLLSCIGVSVFSAIAGGFAVPGEGEEILGGVLGGAVGGLLIGFAILLITAFYFLFLYAWGELIYLALAIEENTREAAMLLRGKELTA